MPMPWRIVDLRSVTSAEGLTPLELAQLRVAGWLYDGVDRAPELRFVELPVGPEHDEDGDGHDHGCLGATGFLSASKVYDGDHHRYDLWVIDPDSAALFTAGTSDPVAGRCQSSWMTVDLLHPYEHAAALDQAMHARGIW
jgi:hypothetical protein